jgi:hypothetical protein
MAFTVGPDGFTVRDGGVVDEQLASKRLSAAHAMMADDLCIGIACIT